MIISLPENLILNICSYLDPNTLARLSRVCKTIQRISSSELLWKAHCERFCINRFPEGKTYQQLFKENFGFRIQSIKFIYAEKIQNVIGTKGSEDSSLVVFFCNEYPKLYESEKKQFSNLLKKKSPTEILKQYLDPTDLENLNPTSFDTQLFDVFGSLFREPSIELIFGDSFLIREDDQHLWNFAGDTLLSLPEKSFYSAGAKNAKKLILAQADKNHIEVWDLTTKQIESTFSVRGTVQQLVIKEEVIFARFGVGVDMFDINGNPKGELTTEKCLLCEWNEYLIGGFATGTIKFWNAVTKKEIVLLEKGHNNAITAFHTLGFFIFSSDNRGLVNVWDMRDMAKTGRGPLQSIETGQNVSSLYCNPKQMYTFGSDEMKVWDLITTP